MTPLDAWDRAFDTVVEAFEEARAALHQQRVAAGGSEVSEAAAQAVLDVAESMARFKLGRMRKEIE